MVLKSECSELIEDYVMLLEKQTEGLSREELTDVLEIICSGRSGEYPYIQLGEDSKLYMVFEEGRKEVVTTENIREVFDYEAFQRNGVVEPLKKAA